MPGPRSLRISVPFTSLTKTSSPQTSPISPQLRRPTSPKSPRTPKFSLSTTLSTTPLLNPQRPLIHPFSPSPTTECIHRQQQHHYHPLPPPPRTPLPWTWRCHLCNTLYRLSTTRRCLLDGHEICFSAPPSAAARRDQPKRKSRVCTAEFDYLGWAAWNAWRRDVVFVASCGGRRRGDVDADEEAGADAKMRRDCWADCDFPSECLRGRGGEGASVEGEGDEVSPLPLDSMQRG